MILNWNGWKDTIECLESVFRQGYENYQVIVCDNDSQDGSIEKIQQWANGALIANHSPDERLSQYVLPALAKPVPLQLLSNEDVQAGCQVDENLPLVLIRTGGNLGFAGGNNVGIRFAMHQAASDFVWLLNNDTIITPTTLQSMVNHSESLYRRGMKNTCGSVQKFYYYPDTIQALGGFRFNRWTGICSATLGMGLTENTEIDHSMYREQLQAIHGCSWLLPRYFLDDVGLMEEQYFLYYEEIDWALRSPQYTLTYADEAVVYHKEGGSIGSRSKNKRGSMLSEFYANRNKYKLAWKFFPWAIPTVCMGMLGQAANALRRGDVEKFILLVKVAFGKSRFTP